MEQAQNNDGDAWSVPRSPERIDQLLTLIARDWKNTGSDQRFFQYLSNLQGRLDLPVDSYYLEDEVLIAKLGEVS